MFLSTPMKGAVIPARCATPSQKSDDGYHQDEDYLPVVHDCFPSGSNQQPPRMSALPFQ